MSKPFAKPVSKSRSQLSGNLFPRWPGAEEPEQLSDDEVLAAIQQTFRDAPPALHEGLINLFRPRISYLKDPAHLKIFRERFRRYGPRIYEQLNPRFFLTQQGFYQDVLFLMLARGTVKDLVWRYSELGKEQLRTRGARPEALFNLFDPVQVQTFMGSVLSGDYLKDPQGLSDQLRFYTGHSLDEFLKDGELFQIFADQAVYVLRDVLSQRKGRLPKGNLRIGQIEALLAELGADTYGDLRFVLTSRDIPFLKGGDRAGDCTACGSFSAWAEGSWNATFENFELETYHQGEFFARFIGLAGELPNRQPVLWIHAVEFTPLARAEEGSSARKSRFADAALQKQLLIESLRFIKAFAWRSGIPHVHMTRISNSFGFINILKGLLEEVSGAAGLQFEQKVFRLLNGANSAHEIQALVSKEPKETVGLYLQGWKGSTQFEKTQREDQKVQEEALPKKTTLGGREINRDDLDAASRLFMQMIRDRVQEDYQTLDQLSPEGVKKLVAEAVDQTDSDAAFEKMGSQISETALQLTRLLTPALWEMWRKRQKRFGRISEREQTPFGNAGLSSTNKFKIGKP